MIRAKRDLEIVLSGLEPIPRPRVDLEQYQTPPDVAAGLLWWASLMGDLAGKRVVDLGCGNGILTLGSCLLGAREAVGYDVDPSAVVVAWRNARKLGVDCARFHVADVSEVGGRYDTCVQNPPFGVRRRGADVEFLLKALEISKVVYSLHKAGNSDFLARKAAEVGGVLTHATRVSIKIPRMFEFHEKRLALVEAEVLRFEVR